MAKKKFIKISTNKTFSLYSFEKYALLAFHTGTNYAPHSNTQEMSTTILDRKSFMLAFISTAEFPHPC